jgi:DNA-binding CsgD family transcriptional regulator
VTGLGELSRREREVLGLLSFGMTDAQIGARLSLAPSTVRNHVAALYRKIGVHSRSSAIVWGSRARYFGHHAIINEIEHEAVNRVILPKLPEASCFYRMPNSLPTVCVSRVIGVRYGLSETLTD